MTTSLGSTAKQVNGWMIATISLITVIALVAVTWIALQAKIYFSPSLDDVRGRGVVIETVPSKDGRYIAAVFHQGGGVLGNDDIRVEINVLGGNDSEDIPYDAVWVADQTTVFWNSPVSAADVVWLDEDTLRVSTQSSKGDVTHEVDIYDPDTYYNWADEA